jgi:NAD(P)-dependent dehydrogenase (short-subunit alcohol dehydrogenase family)
MGASSGIGRATALRSAEQGAAAVVATRGEPGLKSVGHRDKSSEDDTAGAARLRARQEEVTLHVG